MEILVIAGIDIDAICGGIGKCGKCKVIVKDRHSVNQITAQEKNILSEDEISRGLRLSCFVQLNQDVTIIIPNFSLKKEQRILCEGIYKKTKFQPCIEIKEVSIPKPLLGDKENLLDSIKRELMEENILIDYLALKKISNEIHYGRKYDILKFKDEIIGVCNKEENIFGIALDLGTTTVVAYLIDMKKGDVIDIEAILNPQIKYGEDVISRITYSIKKGANTVNESIIGGINQSIDSLCKRNGIKNDSIYEVVVVGNTVMHHILLGLNLKNLSSSPFTPTISKSIDIKSRDLGIKINPSGNVHVLPIVSGFIGADTVGVLLATEIYKDNSISLAIDVGTNGELVLGNKNKMLSCSCAAGPALEGGNIKFGMRASSGAIESVFIEEETFKVFYKTINNKKPRGICGSGIIDIVSEMLRVGILDPSGNIKELKHERIRKNLSNNQKEYVIEWKENTTIGKDLVITAQDIREIQLAKGAIMTGINILIKKLKIEYIEIENLYLAGAFGNYIDIENAIRIGLIPNISMDRIKSVGNAAGEGAKMSLISRKKRMEETIISKKIKYIELASEEKFNEEFVKSLKFPEF